jgi:hypothetical protein
VSKFHLKETTIIVDLYFPNEYFCNISKPRLKTSIGFIAWTAGPIDLTCKIFTFKIHNEEVKHSTMTMHEKERKKKKSEREIHRNTNLK